MARTSLRASVARQEENADFIRAFLSSVEPPEGCCSCGDDSFRRGRQAIARLASALDTGNREALPDIAACEDMLEFLSGVRSHHAQQCFGHTGQEEACGFTLVLHHIRDCIASTVADRDRPQRIARRARKDQLQ